jgi:SynChlorMet cassette radical SAM/SPASM protein ScmE
MSDFKLMSTPRSLDIAITGQCNLRCHYCFYADEMVARSDLSTEQWLVFFDQLGGMKVKDVCLTGGEVFTRRDLFELIDGIVANHMRYSILTNGTLITEKMMVQFEKGKRRLRMDSIQVSIDGSTAEIHNMSRPASFEKAVRGLRLLTEAGYPVTVRVTINRHNLYDLENIAHFLLEEIGLPSFSTNDAMPVGAGCNNSSDISLLPSEQYKAMQIISRLLKKYPDQMQAQAGPQSKIKMYGEMENARATGEKTTRWQMGYLSACGCTFSGITVMQDGSIVPCIMLPEVVLGNILTEPLSGVWKDHPVLQVLRNRRTIPMADVQGCDACEWVQFCNGSCPGLAHQLTGDFNRANPIDCYRNYIHDNGQFISNPEEL